ncbi:hypothetical protein HMPREF1428_01568 [Helicobacter pylori GAM83T]|nr:hypothetical protein HMPREF1428_01568 [Helicobacter pylori GAM83T]
MRIKRDYRYASSLLLVAKMPLSVFKQAPFFKEGFQYANT